MAAIQPPQTMSLDVGSRLGHYAVTALIGEGGMGQVYQVKHGYTSAGFCGLRDYGGSGGSPSIARDGSGGK